MIDVDAFVERVGRRVDEARTIVGLVGPPGVGKSTVADRLRRDLGAVVAPMDGFHRRNADLDRLGLRSRKGAPETFDAEAFVDRVAAVRAGDHDVAWPRFDRDVDEPEEGAHVVPAAAGCVVVEGNYLLLDRSPWHRLPPLLDDVAFLVLDDDVRRERLIRRHVEFGRSRGEAERFVTASDEVNALLVAATAERATVLVECG